jgi:hypothetical protein
MIKKVSTKEIIITMIVIAVIVSLLFLEAKLYGGPEVLGSKTAALHEALLSFTILGLAPFCIIFQGLRIGSPLFGAIIGVMVSLAIIVTSIITGRAAEDAPLYVPLIFLAIAIGLGVGTSFLGRKLPGMSASARVRVWGLPFLLSGVVLFFIGQELPKGIPWGIAAWLLQGLGIYLGFFLGILKIVRGR